MDLLEIIKQLGLSETESKIYLTLLKLKKCTVIELSKEVDVHRRSIYDNLNLLMKKGLVSYKLDVKKKMFQATNPKNLKIILEEKSRIFDEAYPLLESLYESNDEELDVNIYQGNKSLKFLLEDVDKTEGRKYWIGSGNLFFYKVSYLRDFITEKIGNWDILSIQPMSEDLKILKKGDYIGPKNLRILPDEFKTDTGVIIYGNKVGLAVFGKYDSSIVIINNSNIVNFYKAQFNFLWKYGEKFNLINT